MAFGVGLHMGKGIVKAIRRLDGADISHNEIIDGCGGGIVFQIKMTFNASFYMLHRDPCFSNNILQMHWRQ